MNWFFTIYTVYTVNTIQTVLHYLNSSTYACILWGKVRTLLEWADELLSKILDRVHKLMGDIP